MWLGCECGLSPRIRLEGRVPSPCGGRSHVAPSFDPALARVGLWADATLNHLSDGSVRARKLISGCRRLTCGWHVGRYAQFPPRDHHLASSEQSASSQANRCSPPPSGWLCHVIRMRVETFEHNNCYLNNNRSRKQRKKTKPLNPVSLWRIGTPADGVYSGFPKNRLPKRKQSCAVRSPARPHAHIAGGFCQS